MSSDQVTTEAPDAAEASPAPASGRRPGAKTRWGTIALAIIALNVLAFILFPPFPKGGQPGEACEYPTCFIQGNFEFPVPHVVLDFDPANAPAADQLVTFHPSISSTIVTMWIVIGVILIAVIAATRGRAMVPGRVQNFSEFVYESLQNFGLSLGGEAGRPYIPLFAAFFLFILLSNWSGLIPPIGKIEELRAPTSDVNITLGLALVSFCIFEGEGFRKLGFAGYAGKFFPLYEFKNGIGAGLIAMFVGLVELMLEFVKLLTLSMRLFGNIYGGEVAVGVITALTISIIPIAIYGLEFLLNAVQALIFSVLTLMFILLAIESHHEVEGAAGHEAIQALEGHGAYESASAG